MYRKVRNTSKPFGERVTALNKLRLNLKNQAIAVVCVSALISCVCYLILNSVGTYLLDQCLSKQVHVEQRNKEMLQSYSRTIQTDGHRARAQVSAQRGTQTGGEPFLGSL